MTKSYFELGGHLVEVDAAHTPPSPQMHGPSGVSQIAQQQAQPAARNGRMAASPRMHRLPYTVGVGRGNPVLWLGASAILVGAQVLAIKYGPTPMPFD